MYSKGEKVWIRSLLALFVVLVACCCFQMRKEQQEEDALRKQMTALQFAQHEVAKNNDAGAIEDLRLIPESSAEYAEAQVALAAAEQRIQLRSELSRPPNTQKAERLCKDAMRSKEEFPSTIDVNLIDGVSSSVDPNAREISVTIKYEAKNDSGAELPYQVDCTTDYSGNLVNANRHGR